MFKFGFKPCASSHVSGIPSLSVSHPAVRDVGAAVVTASQFTSDRGRRGQRRTGIVADIVHDSRIDCVAAPPIISGVVNHLVVGIDGRLRSHRRSRKLRRIHVRKRLVRNRGRYLEHSPTGSIAVVLARAIF